MAMLPRIIKGKVDLAPEHQAIDTCELEEIKLCGFFISVLGAVRCLVLLLCHFRDNELYRDFERGRCMVYISYIVNHKPQGRERSSRMCMRGINPVCFKIEI
jgi:hypothetical protein